MENTTHIEGGHMAGNDISFRSFYIVGIVVGGLIELYALKRLVRDLLIPLVTAPQPRLTAIIWPKDRDRPDVCELILPDLSLQEVADPASHARNVSEQKRSFLALPPEIRTRIYSYILPMPDINLASYSRALRRTCRQIDAEVKYEVQADFVRGLRVLQDEIAERPMFGCIDVSYTVETFHVDLILQVPAIWPPVSAAQTTRLETELESLSLLFLSRLRLSTRSVSLTLRQHPQGSGSNFEIYMDCTWDALASCMLRIRDDAPQGMFDLQRITVLAESPMVMMLEIRHRSLSCRLPMIDIVGITFYFSKKYVLDSDYVLGGDQRFPGIVHKMIRGTRTRTKLLIRYKRG